MMRVQINLCNITSARASKKEGSHDVYVNLSSKNSDGTTSQFSLTFKNASLADFEPMVLQPVSFQGYVTGMIWEGKPILQASGTFGAPITDKKPA